MVQRILALAATVVLPLSSMAATLVTATPAEVACTHVRSDFNADGHADVAASAPWHSTEATLYAGRIVVTYGSSSGLVATGSKVFDAYSLPSFTPKQGDLLGYSLATGNFNGDCYADLAVGIPGRAAIAVLYGSAQGLTTTGAAVIDLNGLDPGTDANGISLTSGDFDKDGKADLAVGLPFGHTSKGAVAVLRGSSTGLTTTGDALFTQDSTGVPGTGENGDEFGSAVAAGDFTGDGYADLAVGSPGESYGTVTAGGSVTVLKGSAAGLTGTGSKSWTEDTSGVPGTGENLDQFGGSLAAGDITGDGKADLAIGSPGEGVGATTGTGAVTILHGSSTSILTTSGAQGLNQDSSGVPGTGENGDEWGTSLTLGDVNGDGHADLAVGTPYEAVGSLGSAGSVTILPGRSTGVTTSGAKAWDQDTAGVAGASEAGDEFGFALAALPIRSTGHADLVIGDAGETAGSYPYCGAFAVLPGGSSGLTATGNQLFAATDLASAENNAYLGWAVA